MITRLLFYLSGRKWIPQQSHLFEWNHEFLKAEKERTYMSLVSLYVSETNLIFRSLLQRVTEQVACVSARTLGSNAARWHSTRGHSSWRHTRGSLAAWLAAWLHWRHSSWRHWHTAWCSRVWWSVVGIVIRVVVRVEVLRWHVVIWRHVGVAVILRIHWSS